MPSFKVCPDGVYIHTVSPMVDGWEECPAANDLIGFADEMLEKEAPHVDLKWIGAKIPMSVIAPVIGTIRKFPNMETGYMLYYSIPKREWMVKCPKQLGSAGSVRFNDDGSDMPPTFFPIGTIHTHPNMQAFWSGTDKADQKGKYAVHMVFGLRSGVIDSFLITLFSPRGEYNRTKEDLFEADVDLKADCEAHKEWVDTINLSKQPDFKIIQNGKEFGPGVKPLYIPNGVTSRTEFKHFDINGYSYKLPINWEPKVTVYKDSGGKDELRPFAHFLVDTYGYDPVELADWFSENSTDNEDQELVYGQDLGVSREKHVSSDALVFASREVEDILNDNWSIWDHPEDIVIPEPIADLVKTLKALLPVNFVREVHRAAKLTKEQLHILNVLNLWIPKITIRMMLSDMTFQLDNMICGDRDLPIGGRFFSDELQLFAEMCVNMVRPKEGLKVGPADLAKLLSYNSGSRDSRGFTALTWEAMAVLFAYLFPFPEDIAFYWEVLRRMEKEGTVWC